MTLRPPFWVPQSTTLHPDYGSCRPTFALTTTIDPRAFRPGGITCRTSGHAAAVPATSIGVMESRPIRMVAVPLMADRIRPCRPELRSDERMSLPLTPIAASPPAGLTLETIGALF